MTTDFDSYINGPHKPDLKPDHEEAILPDVGFPSHLKVGYFDFLNCLPLYWDMLRLRTSTEMPRVSMAVSLQEQLQKQRFTRPVEQTLCHGMAVQWQHGTPTYLNQLALQEALALSPISSLVYLQNREKFTLWPELGIVSQKDQILSVALYTQTPPLGFKPGQRFLVPDASETSVALLACMLNKMISPSSRWQDGFEVYRHGEGLAHIQQEEDKTPILMIGDEALIATQHIDDSKPRTSTRYTPTNHTSVKPSIWHPLDLASLWYAQTKHPFVFGVWVSPVNLSAEDKHGVKTVVQMLVHSHAQWRTLNKEQQRLIVKDALIHRQMNPLLTDSILSYLNEILAYHLSTQHMTSLELFARQLKSIGWLVP